MPANHADQSLYADNRGVTIRTYQADDVDPLVEAVLESKRELLPWMPWCHENYGRADAAGWVNTRAEAWRLGIEKMFVIAGPGNNVQGSDGTGAEMLGGCGLHRIDPVNGVAEAGYWVRTSAAGRGVATWALGLMVRWAFKKGGNNGGLHRIEIIASTENRASHRVAEKVGAKREGVLASRLLLQGRRHDAVVFTLTNPQSP